MSGLPESDNLQCLRGYWRLVTLYFATLDIFNVVKESGNTLSDIPGVSWPLTRPHTVVKDTLTRLRRCQERLTLLEAVYSAEDWSSSVL